MTLSEIRRTVNSLRRRLALPLAVVRARRATESVCDHLHALQSRGQPLPHHIEVVQMVGDSGFRQGEFMPMNRYVRRCLEQGKCPNPKEMVRALLPRAARLGLVYECFRWDMAPRSV